MSARSWLFKATWYILCVLAWVFVIAWIPFTCELERRNAVPALFRFDFDPALEAVAAMYDWFLSFVIFVVCLVVYVAFLACCYAAVWLVVVACQRLGRWWRARHT